MLIRYIREFLHHEEQRGLTPKTIWHLKKRFRYFVNYMDDKGYKYLSQKAVLGYKTYLLGEYKAKVGVNKGKRISSVTVKYRLLAVKTLCRYLTENNVFLQNPARKLVIPWREPPIPKNIPSTSDIHKMIDRISSDWNGLRDKAILELMYSTAIRANELICLKIYDVDLENKRLMIQKGKGQKDRVVPFGKRAYEHLKIYMTYLRPRYAKSKTTDRLFINQIGKFLNYKALIRLVCKYRTTLKIMPHTIRHAVAVEMLKNGADIRYIQELLGHANLSSTQIYTKLMPKDLKRTHTKHHPRQMPKIPQGRVK